MKETGAFIGDCGISVQNIDGELLPEIGYHVNKNYWRGGYAKEACAADKVHCIGYHVVDEPWEAAQQGVTYIMRQ